jgi:hypothetical protein
MSPNKQFYRVFFIVAAAVSLIPLAAYARNSEGSFRMDREPERAPAASLVKIKGTLLCESEPCKELKLKENDSGRVFTLSQADQAMEMFKSGVKNVMVEGTQSGKDTLTLEVQKTQRL